MDDLRAALIDANLPAFDLQSLTAGARSSIAIRVKKTELTQDELLAAVQATVAKSFPGVTPTIEQTEYVGPAVGRHLVRQAFFALVFSFIGIIIYVAFRFHSGIWGAAGVLGIMHDCFVIFGIFSILNKEITLTIVAALLTIAGYSINDTIVIFDRIRENLRLMAKEDFGKIINVSINQTLSRSLITAFIVFMTVVVLYVLGGEVLRDFALAMVIGTVVGSYSTIYVCVPMVYDWELFRKRRMASQFKGGKKA
jgi:protein-export membrane protein, SecD/SecF family/protein-export membrane protein SecF